jgi:hypothetical protein
MATRKNKPAELTALEQLEQLERREAEPEMTHLSMRLERTLAEMLGAEARKNSRALTRECEYRLKQSFNPTVALPPDEQRTALALYAAWRGGGTRALVGLALDLENPDEDEWVIRWHQAAAELRRRMPAGEVAP